MRRFMSITLLVASLGCSKEEPVSEIVDDVIAELNEQISIICDCHTELGYASASECETDFGYIGPSQRRCVIDAYGQDEEAARDYLECIRPLEKEYTACANTRLDCSDFTTLEACDTDYSVGLDQCITLPESIERDLEACFE